MAADDLRQRHRAAVVAECRSRADSPQGGGAEPRERAPVELQLPALRTEVVVAEVAVDAADGEGSQPALPAGAAAPRQQPDPAPQSAVGARRHRQVEEAAVARKTTGVV